MEHTAVKTLNSTQLMLLKLFNRNLSEQETLEIQELLLSYLDKKIQTQVAEDMKRKNITQNDLDVKLNEQQRTKK